MSLVETREALRAVAELLLAGPQYRATGELRLSVRAGGFGTAVPWDDVQLVAVDGTELVVFRTEENRRVPLAGTLGNLAAAAGLSPYGLGAVYGGSTAATPDSPVTVDPAAAGQLCAAWGAGDAALRAFGLAVVGAEAPEPILWPEHFDVAVTVDAVNYGVSPGDAGIPEPYAYVGPHTPRGGEFWNQPYGAARTVRELGGEPGILDFFRTGRALTT
jgi:hypothetical protein